MSIALALLTGTWWPVLMVSCSLTHIDTCLLSLSLSLSHAPAHLVTNRYFGALDRCMVARAETCYSIDLTQSSTLALCCAHELLFTHAGVLTNTHASSLCAFARLLYPHGHMGPFSQISPHLSCSLARSLVRFVTHARAHPHTLSRSIARLASCLRLSSLS